MDPVLVGRLWQIAKSMTDSRHNVFRYVEHLTALFSEMRSSLSSPDDPILRSFVLIFSVQPDIFDQLSKAPLFQQDPAQRSAYDQLLNEWNQECLQIRQRIAEPSTFRLPKVIDELMRGQDALRRLLSLLRERESSVPEAAPQEQSAGPSAPLSIRGEDAIRLFQEMDRSDRELFQS